MRRHPVDRPGPVPTQVAAPASVPAAALAAVLAAVLAAGLALAALAAPTAAQEELRVTFLHTSDEHSHLLPFPLADHRPGGQGTSPGGLARLATVVEEWRSRKAEASEPVLLTSAGDHLGGTPFAWLLLEGRAPELGLMVELGYDLTTLGNHEFDYDAHRLAGYLRAAGFPEAAHRTAIVASNTRPPADHPLADVGLRRHHLLALPNGLRVGVVGLLGDEARRFVTLADPVEFDDAVPAARSAVAELRQAGAQLVVAVTHSGLTEDRALARAVPDIDLILGGHDHLLLEEPVVEGSTIIVHPGAYLRQVTLVEIGYDPATGRTRLRNPETGSPFVIRLDTSVAEEPAMAARVEEHRRRVDAKLDRYTLGQVRSTDQVVARSDFVLPARPPMRESPFGNFVTDAIRRAAEAATGRPVDFAFQANGVIRGDMVHGTMPGGEGHVVAYDLAGVVGMGAGLGDGPGYPLVSVWLTGQDVRRVLEVGVLLSELLRDSYYLQASGLRMRYDPRRAILFRVPFRGTPIPTGRAVLEAERQTPDGSFVPLERNDDRLYHVVTDRYVASFLPVVGQMLPRLAITARDADGRPIHDLDDAIIRRDGLELAVWTAVLDYATTQPPGPDGLPRIDDRYARTEGRLVIARATPILLLPTIAGAIAIAALVITILVTMKRRAGEP